MAYSKGRKIANWVLFGLAVTIYVITTIICGMFFGSNTHKQEGVEIIFFLIFAYECIAYFACFILSLIGTLAANIKRREQKVFFPPIITLVLSVITWIVFFLVSFL